MVKIFIFSFYTFFLLNLTLAAPSPDCTKCEKDSRHYVDHYDYLRCTPIMRSDCPKCVQRYECPRNYLVYTELDNSVCHIANETYKVGQVIDYHKRFCSYCSCFNEETLLAAVPSEDGEDGNVSKPTPPKVIARPRCSRLSCRESTLTETSKHCFQEPDGDSCCPKITCIPNELLKNESCEYSGRTYAYGETIAIDSCTLCTCSAKFRPDDLSECHKPRCGLEDRQLNDGCIPIYTETCCPSNYYCVDEDQMAKKLEPFDSKVNRCYFNGKNYDIGDQLPTDNNCIKCECRIPPYFTCKPVANCD